MSQLPYILYIEDERFAIALVREALRPFGYDVVGATSGVEGLRKLRHRRPDLVLLDLMMPNTNGFDVYRTMKMDNTLKRVPVIIVTAKVPENGNIIIGGLPPVDEYITKPFQLDRLIRSVKTILSRPQPPE